MSGMGGGASVRRGIWLGVALLLASLSGCAPSRASGEQVTEADARRVLATGILRTLHGDFRGLCELASSRAKCERDVRDDRGRRVPTEMPKIACVYRLADQKDRWGRTVVIGGQVAVVKGTDGLGEPFETEVLVFHDGRRLVAQNIAWWSGRGIVQAGLALPGAAAPALGVSGSPCP